MANTAQFLSRQSQQSIVVDHHGPLWSAHCIERQECSYQSIRLFSRLKWSRAARDSATLKRMASRNDIVDP